MNKIDNLDKSLPILIADDAATVRKIIRVCLRKLGFTNVVEAENARGALDMIDNDNIKLVISDWQFPDMRSEQLVQELGTRKAKQNVSVLVIANEMQHGLAKEMLGNDSDNLLVKPFTSEVLRNSLESIL